MSERGYVAEDGFPWCIVMFGESAFLSEIVVFPTWPCFGDRKCCWHFSGALLDGWLLLFLLGGEMCRLLSTRNLVLGASQCHALRTHLMARPCSRAKSGELRPGVTWMMEQFCPQWGLYPVTFDFFVFFFFAKYFANVLPLYNHYLSIISLVQKKHKILKCHGR